MASRRHDPLDAQAQCNGIACPNFVDQLYSEGFRLALKQGFRKLGRLVARAFGTSVGIAALAGYEWPAAGLLQVVTRIFGHRSLLLHSFVSAAGKLDSRPLLETQTG